MCQVQPDHVCVHRGAWQEGPPPLQQRLLAGAHGTTQVRGPGALSASIGVDANLGAWRTCLFVTPYKPPEGRCTGRTAVPWGLVCDAREVRQAAPPLTLCAVRMRCVQGARAAQPRHRCRGCGAGAQAAGAVQLGVWSGGAAVGGETSIELWQGVSLPAKSGQTAKPQAGREECLAPSLARTTVENLLQILCPVQVFGKTQTPDQQQLLQPGSVTPHPKHAPNRLCGLHTHH